MTTRFQRLVDFCAVWVDCSRCGLASKRTYVVHYRGNVRAPLCVIGEGPGEQEDIYGFPFIGPAGKRLDKLLVAAGLDPLRDVFVVNMVGCRTPSNRVPVFIEIVACKEHMRGLIGLNQPRALLLLGRIAGSLAGVTSITKQRGRVSIAIIGDHEYQAVATYHPSYINRMGATEEICAAAVEDIQLAWTLAGKRHG